MHGGCFTFLYSHRVHEQDLYPRHMFLENASLRLFFHEEGEELWLSEGLTPIAIPALDVDFQADGIKAADVIFQRQTVTVLGSEAHPCRHYPEEDSDFTSCAREKAKVEVTRNSTCLTPLTRHLVGEDEEAALEPCRDNETAQDTNLLFLDVMNWIAIHPEHFGCLRPCRRVR